MALDDLIAALEAEAAGEIDRILGEARAEAERIETAAADELERQRRTQLDAEERALRADARAEVAAARQEAAARVLRARAQLLDRVFATAADRAGEAVEQSERRDAVAAQLTDALTYLGTEEGTVRCHPAVAPIAREALSDDCPVELEVDEDLPPGFRLDAADGSLTVDHTFPAVAERRRPALAVTVLRLLGPPP